MALGALMGGVHENAGPARSQHLPDQATTIGLLVQWNDWANVTTRKLPSVPGQRPRRASGAS